MKYKKKITEDLT